MQHTMCPDVVAPTRKGKEKGGSDSTSHIVCPFSLLSDGYKRYW